MPSDSKLLIESFLDSIWLEKNVSQNTLHSYRNDLIKFESLSFIKTKILPFAIVALFGIAFFAVSARIWLPGDMMSPAPIN